MFMSRLAIAAALVLAACADGDPEVDLDMEEAPGDRGGDDDRGDDDRGDDGGEENCPQLCKALCAGADDVSDCVETCIDNGCDGPYQKSTPICNYLDRGLLDHRAQVLDRYVVFQPGISKLSDIDTLRFGLDLPESYCRDNPHTTPCSDQSYDHAWWIDSVDLSVFGIPLFHDERMFGDSNLLVAGAGAGNSGIQGYDAGELRANPQWGLSFDELKVLFLNLVLDENKQLAFDPGNIELDAGQVSRLLEGMVGRSLAARRKGCVNDLYCDDDNGNQAYWSDNPDCDFGGCPATSARLPSPWLEIRGQPGGILQLDIDLDLLKGAADLGDCDGVGGGIGEKHCGTKYSDKGRFSVEVDFDFLCQESGEDKFAIVAHAADVRYVTETGVIDAFPRIAERKIADEFDESVFTNEIAKNLDACPEGSPVTVAANGALTINLASTMACEAEGVECIGHRIYTGGSSFALAAAPSRQVPAERTAAIAPLMLAAPSGSAILAAMEATHGAPFGDIPITATHTDLLDEFDPSEKIPMSTLSAAVPLICAMATNCSADLDFAEITVPPPLENVEALLDCNDPEGDPDSIACQVYLQMRAFVQQPAILDACIAPVFEQLCEGGTLPACDPDYDEPDKYDGAMNLWLLQVKADHETCVDKSKPLEDYIPVPFIDLRIRTGRYNATNGFSFVDFQEAENVSDGEYDEYECRHRPDVELIPDPYEYPNCSGQPGDLGCECKDIDIFSVEDAAADLGFADGAGSHLAHGVNGTGQACDDSSSESGAPVVCGRLEKGAGSYSVCMECGEGTLVGCPCEVDADCAGVESDLVCFGSSQGQGWGPNGGGTCLPDPDVGDNKELLTEMPWFCLDSCDSIDSYDDGLTACLYNQVANLDFAHGTCVDLMGSCDAPKGGNLPGECELEGMHCFVGDDDQCRPECESSEDCGALGFPDWFACDMDGVPRCVPSFCAGPDLPGIGDYCSLFF
jgi:hypothetical protein